MATSERHREYYLANKETVIRRAAEWQRSHKNRYKEIHEKWRKNNNDKIKAAQQKYRKDAPIKYLLGLARRRAKRKGIEFSIQEKDLVVPSVCPLLGIPIDAYSKQLAHRPSIDRIFSSKGYIPGNVIIVSQRANMLKNNACADELLTLAINLIELEDNKE